MSTPTDGMASDKLSQSPPGEHCHSHTLHLPLQLLPFILPSGICLLTKKNPLGFCCLDRFLLNFVLYRPFFGCERKNKAGTQTNNPGAVLEHQTPLTCPKGSKWLLVSLSFWKDTSCLIQWAPAAGESGCTYSLPGMAGSALPATILTAEAGKQTSNKEMSSRWEEPRHHLFNVGAELLMLKQCPIETMIHF